MHIFRSKVLTKQASAITTTVKNQPSGAIAFLGIEASGGLNNAYGIINAGTQTESLIPAVSMSLVRGSRSMYGTLPLEPGDIIFVSLNISDPLSAGPTFDVSALFLVADNDQEMRTRTGAIPFKASGAYDTDTLVQFEQTSAANTPQTLTVGAIGNIDQLEIVAAWFYNSGAGTATGNFGYWDGTTRTDIDTTVAVASYVFNVGAKGPRPRISGGSTSLQFRFVIGAGGVAITTQLYVIARPIAHR